MSHCVPVDLGPGLDFSCRLSYLQEVAESFGFRREIVSSASLLDDSMEEIAGGAIQDVLRWMNGVQEE